MAKHCWHRVSGIVYDTNPPWYPVQCCWCGIHNKLQYQETAVVANGHGPHGPKNVEERFYDEVGECKPVTDGEVT